MVIGRRPEVGEGAEGGVDGNLVTDRADLYTHEEEVLLALHGVATPLGM